jgi:hypothetical protein
VVMVKVLNNTVTAIKTRRMQEFPEPGFL